MAWRPINVVIKMKDNKIPNKKDFMDITIWPVGMVEGSKQWGSALPSQAI